MQQFVFFFKKKRGRGNQGNLGILQRGCKSEESLDLGAKVRGVSLLVKNCMNLK